MEDQLAYRIKLCILQSELTVREIAQFSGLSTTALYQWMAGRTAPSAPALAVLCRALGISADYLLGLDEIYEERIRRGRKRKKRPGTL